MFQLKALVFKIVVRLSLYKLVYHCFFSSQLYHYGVWCVINA